MMIPSFIRSSRLLFCLLSLFSIALLFSCQDDCEENGDCPPDNESIIGSMWVMNEGTFGSGSASLSVVDLDSGDVTYGAVQTSNGLPNLGDTGQSIAFKGDTAFLVMNGSGTVVAIDKNDYSILKVIEGFSSPRYFLPINGAKAYVSNIFSNEVQIVDLNSLEITGGFTVDCGADTDFCWTEKMVLADGKVFIANMKESQIAVVDPNTDAVINTVEVRLDPADLIVLDDQLWVMCGGGFCDFADCDIPAIYRINIASQLVNRTYLFESEEESPSYLRYANDNFYYMNGGMLYSFPENQTSLPTIALADFSAINVYGLDVNPSNYDLYLLDANDFTSNGTVNLLDENYNISTTYNVGINPNSVYFLE